MDLAKLLIEEAEKECKLNNYSHVLLDVRETQKRAIKLYEQIGYKLWGELPVYHKLNEQKMVSGKYYYKHLGDIMIIFPAIDLSQGKIVRLEKGDFEKKPFILVM